MKKVLTTILCVILAIVAFAQENAAGQNAPSVASVTIQAGGDTLKVAVDTVSMDIPVVAKCGVDFETPTFVEVPDGGQEYILYKGAAYGVSESIPDGFFDRYNRVDKHNDYEQEKIRQIVKMVGMIVAIAFPCLTIVIALICVLVFLMKRYNSKNAIIAKAIENGYDLPDSFYTGQSAQSSVLMDNSGDNGVSSSVNQISSAFKPVPPGARDPKMFTSSVTLIAVGLSILFFFGLNGESGVGFLCGGIPLFLGIGRLVAYLYVPGARNNSANRGNVMPQQPMYHVPQHPNYPNRRYDAPCPPPPPVNQHNNFSNGDNISQSNGNGQPMQ